MYSSNPLSWQPSPQRDNVKFAKENTKGLQDGFINKTLFFIKKNFAFYIQAYLFCGLLTFAPVSMSILFSLYLCHKSEKKSQIITRILSYLFALTGFYPQYLAGRYFKHNADFWLLFFLAPTGAQEVTLSVCVSVCPSVIFVNSSLNLHAIFMQSLSSQLAVS